MIEYQKSLLPFNTFHIQALAQAFARFASLEELKELLEDKRFSQRMILGGGSNILLTRDYPGLVLKNECHGIDVVTEDHDFVYLKCGGGENWHQVVMHTVSLGWGGLENLSLIPGCVGASPMQNIGAYGVEIVDVFHSLDAWHIGDKALVTFGLDDCAFGYRESEFKRRYKNQFVILNVTYRLRKTPVFNTGYGALVQELEKMGVTELSVKAISDAVMAIRRRKLPDPAVTGNAGSFFKNPAVANDQYLQLTKSFPGMPGYAAQDGFTKVPAGWLIEHCGWKGYRQGDAGVHTQQALVLVNYGRATGQDIYDLSETILQSVQSRFGIMLEREVNII